MIQYSLLSLYTLFSILYTFLKHLLHEDHDEVWKHLNTKVDNIEEKIKKAAEDLKKELHEDVKQVKSK